MQKIPFFLTQCADAKCIVPDLTFQGQHATPVHVATRKQADHSALFAMIYAVFIGLPKMQSGIRGVQRRSLSSILASEKSLGCHAGRINQGGCFAYLKFDNPGPSACKRAHGLSAARNVSGLNGILGPRAHRATIIFAFTRTGAKGAPRVEEQRLLYRSRAGVCDQEREKIISLPSRFVCGCAQNKCVIAQLK